MKNRVLRRTFRRKDKDQENNLALNENMVSGKKEKFNISNILVMLPIMLMIILFIVLIFPGENSYIMAAIFVFLSPYIFLAYKKGTSSKKTFSIFRVIILFLLIMFYIALFFFIWMGYKMIFE